jgi:threonine dehydrogenase-like Zn-dependent dehydrogenase
VTSPPTSLECFLAGPRRFETRTRALDSLPPEWVRVQFLYCGICGSDMSEFEGRRAIAYPASLGHEFIAEVKQVGEAVNTLTPGDLVTSDLNYRCGHCEQCRADRSHLCRDRQVGFFSNRAFAHAADIHASYLLPLQGPPARHLTLSEPLSCALHAKRWTRLRPDDRILVIGAGGIGLSIAFALCTEHPSFAFEVAELSDSRRALIGDAVATSGRAITAPDGEYEVVFDASGTESGLRTACAHVKPGGRLCLLSHLEGYTAADFLLEDITPKDITFTVSYINGQRENLKTAARLLSEHWTPTWDALLEVIPIEQLQEAFERRRTSPWCKTLIHIDWSSREQQDVVAADVLSAA